MWQLKGEKNTKFFHRIVDIRRRQNSIQALEIEGKMVDNSLEVKCEMYNHFKNIWNRKSDVKPFHLQDGLVNKLSWENKMELGSRFSAQEIEMALNAMEPAKAPGPDGMNAGVIKALWPQIMEEFLHSMKWVKFQDG